MRRISWARLISDILSPPVIWGFLAFPIAFHEAQSPEQALTWALTYTLMVCVIPAIYIGYMVWRGQITDLHMEVRKERIRPFIVSIIGTILAWVLLRWMDAPPLLGFFALVSLVLLGTMLLVTLVWQISMHTMSITCAVVAAGALYGVGPALLLTPLIPVVGAARLKLRRHTLAEVIAGVLLGGAITLVLLLAL
ncbi:MAG TPA: hypothetical protein VHD90_26710, partial [Phototrophicaceae bacterium]|nr:hypothetical protein [Phototrophicaceae bacterium]